MKDFTLTTYRKLLLALRAADYNFYSFEEWCEGTAVGKFVILRHDVDLKADHSLSIAKLEADLGIKATYYFRVVSQSNQPDIIREIVVLGHEIGYHYNEFSSFKGDAKKSIEHFKNQLDYFRQFYPVKTICMHGSPTSTYDNRDLWKKFNYRDYGIIGEPYFDFLTLFSPGTGVGGEVVYFTDTARMWDGDKFNVRDRVVGSEELVVGSRELGVESKKLGVGSEELVVGSRELGVESDKRGDSDKRLVISDKRKNSDVSSSSSSSSFITQNSELLTQNSILNTQNSSLTTHHLPLITPIHSTFDFINWLEKDKPSNSMMITTHPQRWTDNKVEWLLEYILQNVKNRLKQLLIFFRYKKSTC